MQVSTQSMQLVKLGPMPRPALSGVDALCCLAESGILLAGGPEGRVLALDVGTRWLPASHPSLLQSLAPRCPVWSQQTRSHRRCVCMCGRATVLGLKFCLHCAGLLSGGPDLSWSLSKDVLTSLVL